MKLQNNYSSILKCLYDETEPVGSIGRGAHYSVFEVPQWHDIVGQSLQKANCQRFAIVWDEDHDVRIIKVIEKLYLDGLMNGVQFIGERKGTLTVILAPRFRSYLTNMSYEDFMASVQSVTSEQIADDYWSCQFGTFDKSKGSPQNTMFNGIVQSSEDKVETYIRNIDNLWSIGNFGYNTKRQSSYGPL